MKAVIDTNILFSALLKKESKIKTFILDPSNEFYSCNFTFVELFKYKDEIEKISELDFVDIISSMRILFSKIIFIRENVIPHEIAKEAYDLCVEIDEKDTPFIALALFLDIPLITRDKKLINGLKEKSFDKIIPLNSILK